MLKLEKGEIYKVYRLRSGTSETGPWEIITIKEDGGAHREMTMFATNAPSGAKEGGEIRLEEITSVKMKRNKGADGKWTNTDKAVINGIVTPIEKAPGDLSDMLGVDDYYGDLI